MSLQVIQRAVGNHTVSFHLLILIHFSIHCTVNTLPADGRKENLLSKMIWSLLHLYALACPGVVPGFIANGCWEWCSVFSSTSSWQGSPTLLQVPPTFPQLCAHGSHSEEGEDITKKHFFFLVMGVMGKTVAIVCTNQIHNKKDAVPWALPFKVLLLLVLFHSPVNRGKPLVSAIQIVWIFIHKLLMLLSDVHDTLLLKEGAGNFLLLPFSLLFVFSDKTEMKFLLWSSEAQLEFSFIGFQFYRNFYMI